MFCEEKSSTWETIETCETANGAEQTEHESSPSYPLSTPEVPKYCLLPPEANTSSDDGRPNPLFGHTHNVNLQQSYLHNIVDHHALSKNVLDPLMA